MAWILILLGLAILIWLFLLPSAPAMNELPDPGALGRMLRLLVSRGVHKAGIKGTLTVCVKGDRQRRLVFTKCISALGEAGFRAALSRESWAEPYYERFCAELDRRGIPYEEIRAGAVPTLAFELGRDAGGAYMVTKTLFEDVLGLRLDRDCVAYFRDVVIRNTPRLTGVDAPDEGWG